MRLVSFIRAIPSQTMYQEPLSKIVSHFDKTASMLFSIKLKHFHDHFSAENDACNLRESGTADSLFGMELLINF